MHFARLATAMVTPFQEDGEIDYEAVNHLIDHLLSHGTEALVVAGTTGESPTLNTEEKVSLFRHVKTYVGRRAQVIAGTGTNDTRSTIALTQAAEEIGVDGVMVVVPYYNRPSQSGLAAHFEAVSRATKLPIMLYNVPSRTGQNLTAETTIRLSDLPNVVAVKEASGDLSQIARIIEETRDDFMVFSGDDKMLLPILSIGGDGIVSVAAHVVGLSIKEMIEAYFSGDVRRAAALHRRYLPIFEGIFFTASPAPTKALLNYTGVKVGGTRLPIVPLTPDEKTYIQALYDRVIGVSASA
ncbi:MAG: 4-hydroxy-tetrahydrodipicolinate synthase [Candidatus Carbobacillus altaicus]|uniref:4-hydroxy-tetrahydrodipicolinate synthase n=1 Tax=Candidatus Carbonibacillus altaicus TaxID=2163959 RepID=A0A2R6Y198_9BACL|nr:4-hydroxy-tetrahydrodipicolinate synthase [Candidatus Carbobacillus altaicus]PTQ56453.1 MAG: 4-hydroxy-tetrahydrodipicolinate synthase [Candidatus Carbobacillus altaicus]